jgi:nitrous oxidase accessory protein
MLNLILFLAVMFTNNQKTSSIQVRPDTDLQQIIDASAPYDTLLLQAGVWRNNPYLISKPLVIIGENGTQFEATNPGSIFLIKADNVHISQLSFYGVLSGSLTDNAAILVELGHSCTLSQNIFKDNFFAIYLKESHDCIIVDNMIQSDAKSETSSGNGIHLWKSKRALIENNVISGHRDGIYLEFADYIQVKSNQSSSNLRYGLHFMFSNDCSYTNNNFSENGAGVAVMYSSRVEMVSNIFHKNWGPTSYGLLLKDINDSNIRDNILTNNTTGIHSEGSNRVIISRNIFKSNGRAVILLASSNENHFLNNDFIQNTLDVSTNSRTHYNLFESNYWSAYNGYDLDRNGFGDIQHRPVRLFAYLIERNPVAMILLRSLFIELLDAAERIFPVLSPQMLADPRPLMKPNMS